MSVLLLAGCCSRGQLWPQIPRVLLTPLQIAQLTALRIILTPTITPIITRQITQVRILIATPILIITLQIILVRILIPIIITM
ncbi:MAG: hypothetical protein CL756_04625 [Chloroflexi bacterium]|nr:hypothetical protein [Chloroflexota bacterium]